MERVIHLIRFAKPAEDFKGDEEFIKCPLGESGIEQSNRLAEEYKDKEISSFYSEKNPGSTKTMEIVLNKRGMDENFLYLPKKSDFGSNEKKSEYLLDIIKKTKGDIFVISTSEFIVSFIMYINKTPSEREKLTGVKNAAITKIYLDKKNNPAKTEMNNFDYIIKNSLYFKNKKKSIDEKISEMKDYLIDNYKIKSIIIYGSYIKKENKPHSDLDVIIFLDKENISRYIEEISSQIINIFLYSGNGELIFPSLNIWSREDIEFMLPYYLTCYNLDNIRVLYDDGSFKRILSLCENKINRNKYKRESNEIKQDYWIDKENFSTKRLGKFYGDKYQSYKKYAFISMDKEDYGMAIELIYKSGFYLYHSLFEFLGIHFIKPKSAYYTQFFSKVEGDKQLMIKQFLTKYFALISFKKSIHPFIQNATKESTRDAFKILEEAEEIYFKLIN